MHRTDWTELGAPRIECEHTAPEDALDSILFTTRLADLADPVPKLCPEVILLVGSHAAIGSWDIHNAVLLETSRNLSAVAVTSLGKNGNGIEMMLREFEAWQRENI